MRLQAQRPRLLLPLRLGVPKAAHENHRMLRVPPLCRQREALHEVLPLRHKSPMSDRPRDGERCPCGMLMHLCAGSGKMECIDCGPTQHLDLWHDQPQEKADAGD